MIEPLRVLLDPWMVRRYLDREVKRQLEAELAGTLLEVHEIVQRAELGRDRLVSACRAAGRIRTAGVVRSSDQGVVGALAIGRPNRVDRGHVQGVEAHGGYRRQAGLSLTEGRAAGRVGPL